MLRQEDLLHEKLNRWTYTHKFVTGTDAKILLELSVQKVWVHNFSLNNIGCGRYGVHMIKFPTIIIVGPLYAGKKFLKEVVH